MLGFRKKVEIEAPFRRPQFAFPGCDGPRYDDPGYDGPGYDGCVPRIPRVLGRNLDMLRCIKKLLRVSPRFVERSTSSLRCSPAIWDAKARIVGYRKSTTMGMSRCTRSLIKFCIRTSVMELPPISKKLSSMPTCSTVSVSRHTLARILSSSDLGET